MPEDVYKDFLQRLKADGVRWLELHFTDLHSRLRLTSIPVSELSPSSIINGIPKLDGSSVDGFGVIELSDLNLVPDVKTYRLLPWTPDHEKIGRVFSFITKALSEGSLETDPRRVANNLIEKLSDDGLRAYVGPEAEFYLFTSLDLDFTNPSSGFGYYLDSIEAPWNTSGYPTSLKGGYYAGKHVDTVYDFRYDVCRILQDSFNVGVVAHHHEVGVASQVEINIKHSDPLTTADNYMTLKYVAREVADQYGFLVTFMPKPIYGDNGSGLHTHVSIWNGDVNLFYDKDDKYAELSQTGRYFIGGLIEHGRSLSAIVSPTVNSYKRLVPGYEAPIYLAWSRGNRSAAVRVPVYKLSSMSGKRVEYRPPDPLCNPYLAFSAIILAGLDGIKRKLDPGDPVDRNIYHMSEGERRSLGIKSLPRDLYEALTELESDHEYLLPVFSKEIIETYIELKKAEFKKIMAYPTTPEVYKYFSL